MVRTLVSEGGRWCRLVRAGALAALAGMAVVGQGDAAPAPAGAQIVNRASVTYFNTRLGIIEEVESNIVSATVSPVPGLDVTGDQTIRTARSTAAQYNFQAVNTGNVALFAVPALAELPGDDFDTAGDLLVDTNANGIVDSGDTPVVPGQSVTLQPGERVSLIYRYTTPASVAIDDESRVELTVTATPASGGGAPITGARGSRTVIEDATLSLLKAAELNVEERQIAYTITVRNNAESDIPAYGDVAGEAILVDGAPRTALLVRDSIPLNTTFVSAVPSGGFAAVYHLDGDATHSYTATAPADPSRIDAIAFLHEGAYAVGRSSDLAFTVSLSDSIDELNVDNIAYGYTNDGTETRERPSNQTVTPVTGEGPRVIFSLSPDGEPITSTPFDVNVHIAVEGAGCNVTDGIDRVEVVVRTLFIGDREVIVARETGPNTGVFRAAPLGILRATRARPLNNVLEGLPGDRANATATVRCIGGTVTGTLGLQPGGFVFDSVTNAPVQNARVVIFEPDGDIAPIVATPGAPSAANVQLAVTSTDAEGYFSLGELPQGDYKMTVFPPVVYQHPSVRRNFPGFNRRVNQEVSYGLNFSFQGGPIAGIDVPVDPMTGIPIALEKVADRALVRRNGHVIYTLTAHNRMDQALLNASLEDRLPPGLHFIDGSARRDGVRMAEQPDVAEGGVLTFDLDFIDPRSQSEITYAVRVGTAARRGTKTNVAVLSGDQAGTAIALRSTEARADVTVDDRGGVFTDEAVVLGRVFLDRDGNGVQTPLDADGNPHDEPGVPGVKIVTSTGLTVVTDAQGRYSLFGLRPVVSTFALQSVTLPGGAEPMDTNIDDVLAPGSRLVDLKRGEVRTEHFPIRWTPDVAADVAARALRFEGLDADESRLRDDLPLAFDTPSRLSSRGEAGLDTTTEIRSDGAPGDAPAADPADPPAPEDIERQVRSLDPELGFVGVDDGAEADTLSVTLRIKGPTKGALRLELNDETVSDAQIGAKVTDSERGVQVFEYVALRLKPGANTLAAILTDPFGNDRGRETVTVYAPGEPAALAIAAPDEAPADSRARIPVLVRVVDAEGRLTRAPAEVTLRAEKGRWDVRDIRDSTPGLQAYIDDGEAVFDFIPPDLVGAETLTVRSDFGTVETTIGFTPDLTERTFAGVIEGAVGFAENRRGLAGLMTSRDISAFEETTQGVRGQLYLKGKILGSNLLTLRYDSDRDNEERLFRDIRKDEFYPVYGDDSERGFDAQSSSRLYVKVERDRSYILYGDLAVEARADAFRLGAYRRSLTGGRAHVEYGPVTVDLFVAETDASQAVIEIPGRGVSGPYDVPLTGIAEGSEIVEIITRDRDQPSVILSSVRQARLSDYTLDFFAGSLIFDRPVPILDDDLNPVSIRLTYEREDGAGEDYLVYGGEVRVEPVEGIAFGYREVRSDAPDTSDDARTVRAGYAEAELRGWGKVQVEVAQTENREGDKGLGARLSYELRRENHAIRADAARTDEDFDAPNAHVGPGREEVRVTTDHVVTETIGVTTDTLYTRSTETDERRMGAEVRGRYAVWPELDLIGGARATDTRRDGGDDERIYSGIVGLDYRPRFLPGAGLRAEYEQDFKDGDNWRAILGADYQWSPALRFHALNEFSNAAGRDFGLGDSADIDVVTKVGAEYQMTRDISAFSEFRRSGGLAFDGGVANGFRGRWALTEHVAMRAGGEHIEPVNGGDERVSSGHLGVAYDNDATGVLARGDIEGDRDAEGYGVYLNTAVGYELDEDFTLLARNRLALDLRGDDRLRDRLRLGLAWRPEHDSRLQGLALYEFEIDDKDDTREMAHRWSASVIYSPTKDLRADLKVAGEHVDFRSPTFSDDSTRHLLRGGMEIDFAHDEEGRDRFALGGHVAFFTDGGMDDVTVGVGAELKANIAENVQVGVGYTHIDVDENRLRSLYRSGWYLRMLVKLDDSMWDRMDRLGITQDPGFVVRR